ncbi:hypothetical protein LXD69_07315 [Flavobacterium sediminilitoris]|uniref:Lipoprotein n=1 Tax=Flavobacterium sediminilitoris TaxID=2024526 RepID=A0ABY4HRK1_9FLAO|nr:MULTISPECIES: hypothetical protein [Flavobacterium]UOX35320.1 hypothetical protein LXD69_07315 [Flavobacterium sediminilitoris]
MKKLIYIICFFLSISCGSIKKDKTNVELESNSTENTNTSSNTNRWINSNDYILEPVDLSQPMFFQNNGKKDTVWNTRIINNTRYIKEKIKEDTNQNKQTEDNLSIDQKNKETDNTKLILGIVGIVFLFLFFTMILFFYLISKKIDKAIKIIPQV